MIRKQILSAQEYSRNDLSEKEKQQMPEEKTNVQHHLIPGFSKC